MTRCPDCGAENIPGTEDCESCRAPLAPLSYPQPRGDLSKKILEGTLAGLRPREAVSVPPSATVAQAARRMREGGLGSALVVEDGRIAGILSERDLVLSVAGLRDPDQVRVSEVMRADPVCLKEDDPVGFAFHHMTVGGYRHLPVQLDRGAIGMISARDLLRYLSL